MDKVSKVVIEQRVRNRIIEYFKLASSEENLLQYQNNVPIAQVPSELIEEWSTYFDIEMYNAGGYLSPTYNDEELQAILAFESMHNYACENMPDLTYDINEVFKMTWWPKFKEQAKKTLVIFMKRGKLSEDVEEEL